MIVRNLSRLFAAAIGVCAIGSLHAAWQLRMAGEAVAEVNAALGTSARQLALKPLRPEAQLAHALALGRAGQMQPALQMYRALLSETGTVRRAALYDQGNLTLRAALREGEGDAQRSLPFVELAKQSYRDLLREDPQDWDARYNLERALWLSPEYDDPLLQSSQIPTQAEHAASTVRGVRSDLP
jgi:mxaK protein